MRAALTAVGVAALVLAGPAATGVGARGTSDPGPRAAAKKKHRSRGCSKRRHFSTRAAARRARRCRHRRGRRHWRRRHAGAPTGSSRPGSGLGAPTPAPGPAPQPLARYVSVSAREWSLTLSRPAIAAGSGTVELRNVGEDPHDLVLSPDDGSHTPLTSFPETPPGGVTRVGVNLPAGRYLLWCSLAGHESLGMRARLQVGG